MMINREQKKEGYLRDPLPYRLAGLAADLGRVAVSSARWSLWLRIRARGAACLLRAIRGASWRRQRTW